MAGSVLEALGVLADDGPGKCFDCRRPGFFSGHREHCIGREKELEVTPRINLTHKPTTAVKQIPRPAPLKSTQSKDI